MEEGRPPIHPGRSNFCPYRSRWRFRCPQLRAGHALHGRAASANTSLCSHFNYKFKPLNSLDVPLIIPGFPLGFVAVGLKRGDLSVWQAPASGAASLARRVDSLNQVVGPCHNDVGGWQNVGPVCLGGVQRIPVFAFYDRRRPFLLLTVREKSDAHHPHLRIIGRYRLPWLRPLDAHGPVLHVLGMQEHDDYLRGQHVGAAFERPDGVAVPLLVFHVTRRRQRHRMGQQ